VSEQVDVVVVGMGAGGEEVAGRLAEAGITESLVVLGGARSGWSWPRRTGGSG
jgi:choline dehydrogenase-like flavoprotein